MAVMRTVGNGRQLPRNVHVREADGEYIVECEVFDFTEPELTVEALGPLVTVRGDQRETVEDDGKAFRLHERLEESFRLPDDADPDQLEVFYKHGTLEIHAPRTTLEARRLPIRSAPSYLANPNAEAC